MSFIKIEVEERPGYNRLVITPRDDDEETRNQLELINHAIMTQQPKMGGMVPDHYKLIIDVKKEDLSEDLNVSM